MKYETLALAFLSVVVVGAPGCSSDSQRRQDPSDPGPLGEEVQRVLGQIADVPEEASGLEYNIFELDRTELTGDVTAESCDAVDNALESVCIDLQNAGEIEYCSYDTAFFYANQIPRCAVRFHTYQADYNGVSPVHVFDFSGTALAGPAPSCGNGVLDADEECDDGNHELFDGCDSSCVLEPFNGCEAVIEDYYHQAGLALVDQYKWDGARSHLMVHREASALMPVTQASCQASIATAADACRELENTMGFVGWCQPSGIYHIEDSGPECSIRLEVWFQGLDADSGVYTTSLPGILAFTIR